MLFSDQVSILSTWFKNWNECEQTVALFSLLKRVQKRQAKFLARSLEHGLKDCHELIPVDQEANDSGYIGKLLHEPNLEQVIKILLSHLPLLRPGNELAKSQYLNLLPKVLAFAVERSEFLQESRQLLSYSLIHPAFDNDERSSLTSWMAHLDDRIPNVVPGNNYTASNENDESQNVNDVNHNSLWKESQPQQRQEGINNAAQHHSWQQETVHPADVNSNSLAPAPPASGGGDADKTSSLPQDTTGPGQKAMQEDANGSVEYDFNPWLKSLRLHKYKDLFASMSYEEMMQLKEDELEKKAVTKGARDKILLNIKRLHERFEKLQTLEKEIPRGGSLRNALSEMKNMIYTPIKRFEPVPDPQAPTTNPAPGPVSSTTEIQNGDIPGQFTKVMGKACTQILISKPDKDNITTYMHLLEKCIQHPAFTAVQIKRLQSWKSQINKMYKSLPRTQQMSSSQRNPLGSNYPGRRLPNRGLQSFGGRLTSPVASPPLRTSNALSMFSPQVPNISWFGSGGIGNSHTQPLAHTTQPSIEVTRKTASLDPKFVRNLAYPAMQAEGNREMPSHVDPDINNRLDSLCLSVAEHALSGRHDNLDPAQQLGLIKSLLLKLPTF